MVEFGHIDPRLNVPVVIGSYPFIENSSEAPINPIAPSTGQLSPSNDEPLVVIG